MRRIVIALMAMLPLAAAVAPAQTISFFRASGAPSAIAAGPDGNLWFTSSEGVGRITPLGEMTIFPVPLGAYAITAGPRGLMWFTRSGGISAIDSKGTVLKYDTPSVQPFALTAGPGDNLWFSYSDGIGRLTAAGSATLFPLQKQLGRAPFVTEMAAAGDGNVWFTEWPFNQVGRITPFGEISEFATNPPVPGGAERIAAEPDAGLLLTFGPYSKRIARLSTAGAITRINEIGGGSVPYPSAITFGPDGRVWFGTAVNGNGSLLGSMSPDGTINTIAVIPIVQGIHALTAGPDGNVWATFEPYQSDCESVGFCPTPDPTPLAIARVNLVNPVPLIASIERGFDPATNAPSLRVLGVGFVPDSVIRWNGNDQMTIYVSPFELSLSAAEASQAAYGGTFLVRNAAPGGGGSPAFTLKPAAPIRRHATR